MIADFFTKPLQGGLFKYLRDIIMGHSKLPSEERVEINNKKVKVTKNKKKCEKKFTEKQISESVSDKIEDKKNVTDGANSVKNGSRTNLRRTYAEIVKEGIKGHN